jgi:hypothetical protein
MNLGWYRDQLVPMGMSFLFQGGNYEDL